MTYAHAAREGVIRAAIYCRVSQDSRGDQRSVEEQEAECRRYVERMGWQLTGVYVDNDARASRAGSKSGRAKDQRPNWQELNKQLEASAHDALVLWEPSRATRDRKVWAFLFEVCEDNDIRLAVDGKVYDVSDPDDAFQLDLKFMLAVRESGIVKKRTGRARRAGFADGKPMGQCPYGYRRVHNERTGVLERQVPDLVTAPIVQRIFESLAALKPVTRICAELEEEGIVNPRGYKRLTRGETADDECYRWHGPTIRGIASNIAYIGLRPNGDENVNAQWEGLVEEETFWAVQNYLADPTRKVTKPGSGKYLLSYVIKCDTCDGPMQAHPRRYTGKGKTMGRPKYQCKRGCTGIGMELLDEFVEATIVGYLSRPDVFAGMTAADDESLAAARMELETVRHELQTLEKEVEKGMSITLAATAERALLARKAAAEEAVQMAGIPAILAGLAGDGAEAGWESLAMAQKREIVRMLTDIRIRKWQGDRPGRAGRPVLDTSRVIWTWLMGAAAEGEPAAK